MPVYNGADYILESIKSVLTQTFTDFELIIVDDGSTDNTRNIVQTIEDKRVHFIRQVNQGVSSARNTGLMSARGGRVCFLDCDDLYYPNFLETLINIMNETNTEMSFCDFSESYGLQAMKAYTFKKILRNIRKKLLGTRILKTRDNIDYLPMHINSVMVNKSLLDKYKIRFLPNVRMYEDRNFLVKVFLASGKISGTWLQLEHYRRHTDSASLTWSPTEKELAFSLRDEEREFAKKYGFDYTFVDRVERQAKYKTLKWLLKNKSKEDALIYARQYESELKQYASNGERLKDKLICRYLLWSLL